VPATSPEAIERKRQRDRERRRTPENRRRSREYTCVPAHGSGLLWAVTGEAPNLTVHPSINDLDERAPWHGWIRDGALIPA
jgi:hypothetical protein